MNILVVTPVDTRQKAYLESKYPEGTFVYNTKKDVTEAQVLEADIIIGNAPAAMVAKNTKLTLMQLDSAGADAYIKTGIIHEGTLLANATGAYGLAVAEHMFAMTYMLMKKLHLYYENQKSCDWKDEGMVTSFYQSRTLVIGLGDIGCEYAKRAKAMGSYVVGMKRRPSKKPDCVEKLCTIEALEEELSKADIVAMFLPGTEATYHLINANMLAKMKTSALLVNGGRGTAIDQVALEEALDSGVIAGAALDVTTPEPLPAEDPLWKAKNILITPHISGQYHLKETVERIVCIAGRNLEAIRAGEEIINEVDFATGYRK